MKTIIHSQTPTKSVLKEIYETYNKIFQSNDKMFYTKKEVEQLKKDKSNIFIE